MNTKFDELTKAMAQTATRRAALKKFGIGLAGMALAAFGLASNARADKAKTCATDSDCNSSQVCCSGHCYAAIPAWCDPTVSCCCYSVGGGFRRYLTTALTPCYPSYSACYQFCENSGTVIP